MQTFTPYFLRLCNNILNIMFNMPDNQTEIGARLKKIRLELDKNQEDFSVMLLGKKNKATISAYELGKMAIAPKALVVLFTTLNVSKDWLETGIGEMFTTKPRTGDTKSPSPIGKVGKWMHDMRNEFYKKVYDKKYPKTAIEIEIEMLREELDNMEALLRKEKEGQ